MAEEKEIDTALSWLHPAQILALKGVINQQTVKPLSDEQRTFILRSEIGNMLDQPVAGEGADLKELAQSDWNELTAQLRTRLEGLNEDRIAMLLEEHSRMPRRRTT